MDIYLVGGTVRDQLLGLPTHDRDWVVVGATPEEMLAQGYEQVGRDFPVFLHPKTHEEYALARTERKSGRGYTGFICHADIDVTLEQDLQRRDLTINAIARDGQGNLIDPYQGQQDIDSRVLRHVSPAFRDDPLRVLRIARFAARFAHLGFTIAEETQRLMQQMTEDGELSTLTAERVWKETEKALNTPDPQVYFQVLRDCTALALLFPELDKLFGVPAPEKWHPEVDSGLHSLLSLQAASKLSDDISVRFAALYHDVGKGLTPASLWPHHHNHQKAGVPLVRAMAERIKLPIHIRDFMLIATEYHDELHSAVKLTAQQLLDLFDGIDVWRKPERLAQLILVSTADARGRTGLENCSYPQGEYLQQAFEIAREIPVQNVIQDGFTGIGIRNELSRRRIEALTDWIATQAK